MSQAGSSKRVKTTAHRTPRSARPTKRPITDDMGPLYVHGMQHFRDEATVAVWKKYKDIQIEFGRRVPEGFPGYGLHWRFENLGWRTMLDLDYPCYPDLVKLFYCNLLHEGQGEHLRISSMVTGKFFDFGLQDLADVLGVPNEGPCLYMSPRDEPIFERAFMIEMHQSVMKRFKYPANDPLHQFWKINEQELKAIPRLLSRITQHNIYPRGGEREKQRLFQTYIAHCLYTGTKVNLPYIIMRHMISHAGIKGKQVLPFGILLTPLFAAVGIDLSHAKPAAAGEYKAINEWTLSHMGLYRTFHGDSDDDHVPDPAPPDAAMHEPLHPQLLTLFSTLMKHQRRTDRQLTAIMEHLHLAPIDLSPSEDAEEDDKDSDADNEAAED